MGATNYKKLNFNVPALQNDGSQLMRIKVNREKMKKQPDGRMSAEPVMDAEGFAIQEPVMLREVVAQVVDNIYKDEEALEHSGRVARGKLARKLSDKTDGALKNYQKEELELLQECLVKAQAAPSICSQVDEMISQPAAAEAA